MNKSELVKTLSEKQDISVEEAAEAICSFFEIISASLVANDRVEIRRFGTFKMKEYKGYIGRNPKSGDTITVAPKRLPFFKASKELKEYLNE